LTEEELDRLVELIRELVNGVMQMERERHLNTKPYERSEGRCGHANGRKPKTVVRQSPLTYPRCGDGVEE